MKNTSLRLMIALGVVIFLFTSGIQANAILSSPTPNIPAQLGEPGTNPSRVVLVIPGEGYFIRQSGESMMMQGNLSDPLGLKIQESMAKRDQDDTHNIVLVPANEIIVTNSSDHGVGSLRSAIDQANTNPGPDVIHFSMSSSTIILTSMLPPITGSGTVIDASQNWNGSWPTGKPGITIDGGSIGDYSMGLHIIGTQNVTLKGLKIENFNDCIYIENASFTSIGEGASTNGGGRMLIRDCNGPAITIAGGHDNRVLGSYIGTSDAGNLPVPNLGDGIEILMSARNAIGGEGALEGNIIGASYNGIRIIGSDSISNTVTANQIGVGMLNGDIANLYDGVYIGAGATYNIIGGQVTYIPGIGYVYQCTDVMNEIKNNEGNGVLLSGAGNLNNAIMSNYIYGNHGNGIEVTEDSKQSWISCNTIMGSTHSGIFVQQPGTTGHNIMYNFIGIDYKSMSVAPNGNHGIGLYDGSSFNFAAGNFIGNNGWSGVAIVGADTSNNKLNGNSIGVGYYGEPMGNSYYGVDIVLSHDNSLTQNMIAYNGSAGSNAGVHVGEDTAVGNQLTMNYIYSNAGLGIELTGRSQHEISAPVINSVDCPLVSGMAGPIGARVEIYSDSADEGHYYEGSATVDGQYQWTYVGKFRGPNLTAIVTDLVMHDSSAFSAPWGVSTSCYVTFLPITQRYK
jgi:hypothetical protein